MLTSKLLFFIMVVLVLVSRLDQDGFEQAKHPVGDHFGNVAVT